MNNELKPVWLPVKVSSGMFSNELAVEIVQVNGIAISIFANKDLVKKEGNIEYLQVYEFGEKTEGRIRVLLPSEAFETASRWVEVNTNGEKYDFE